MQRSGRSRAVDKGSTRQSKSKERFNSIDGANLRLPRNLRYQLVFWYFSSGCEKDLRTHKQIITLNSPGEPRFTLSGEVDLPGTSGNDFPQEFLDNFIQFNKSEPKIRMIIFR